MLLPPARFRRWGVVTPERNQPVVIPRPGGMCVCPAGDGKGTCACGVPPGYEHPARRRVRLRTEGVSLDQDSKVCSQCAETVKAAAKVCRYCGHEFSLDPSNDGSRQSGGTTALAGTSGTPNEPFFTKEVLIALAAFLVFAVLLGGGLLSLMSREEPVPIRPDHTENAKRKITKDMLDPGSAQFQSLIANGECVTGEVNAKNSFGAYTGFKGFVYSHKTGRTFIEGQTVAFGVDAHLARMKDANAYMQASLNCLEGKF